MRIRSKPQYFPNPNHADDDGLVAISPKIDVARLLDAYRFGIFPWPMHFGGKWIVHWCSPNPRAVLPLGQLRVPKRLLRKLANQRFRFTWNRQFDRVLDLCATVEDRADQGWLSPQLMSGIRQLQHMGHAHSIEVYQAGDRYRSLCGGLYGISVGGLFSAESMFHVCSDASKAAVCALVGVLRLGGFQMLDIQQASPHLSSLGAVEIPRSDYLDAITPLRGQQRCFPKMPQHPVAYAEIT